MWVPDPGHEAMRDLVRARPRRPVSAAPRQQLLGFLLRQGCHYGRLGKLWFPHWHEELASYPLAVTVRKHGP
jgi:hypothetical protein